MIKTFEGFHGTNIDSAKEILQSNFHKSLGDKEWLGDGIYFFIKGLSSKPEEQAEKWAIAQAWNKNKKEYKYKNYCVIKSTINVDDSKFLDLTKEEGLEILEYLTKRFNEKIKSIGKQLKYLDGLLINLARGEGVLNIDVVKGNFYIKFAEQRINNINIRTNNCTICSVYNYQTNLKNIHIIKTGNIRNETFKGDKS